MGVCCTNKTFQKTPNTQLGRRRAPKAKPASKLARVPAIHPAIHPALPDVWRQLCHSVVLYCQGLIKLQSGIKCV